MRCSLAGADGHGTVRHVRDLLILVIHVLVTLLKLVRPGGLRAVVAESLLLKHQILISNRARHRAPPTASGRGPARVRNRRSAWARGPSGPRSAAGRAERPAYALKARCTASRRSSGSGRGEARPSRRR